MVGFRRGWEGVGERGGEREREKDEFDGRIGCRWRREREDEGVQVYLPLTEGRSTVPCGENCSVSQGGKVCGACGSRCARLSCCGFGVPGCRGEAAFLHSSSIQSMVPSRPQTIKGSSCGTCESLSARIVLVDGLELLFVEVWLSKLCS